MPAHTSPPLLPPSPRTVLSCSHYPVSKCPSASIVVTGTVRVKHILYMTKHDIVYIQSIYPDPDPDPDKGLGRAK